MSDFFAAREMLKPYSMFLPSSHTKILISYTDGEQIFLFDKDDGYQEIEIDYVSDTQHRIQHLKFQSSSFIKNGDMIYMPRAFVDGAIGSVDARKEYFTRSPFSSLDISNGICQGLGSFPNDFKSGDHLIKDVYTQLCFNFDTTAVIYGFKYSAQLSKIDTAGNSQHNVTDHISFLFPHDSISKNLSKVRAVLAESPSFESLVSDPYRKVFYRSFKLGMDLSKSDFIPSYYEYPWHLNIYDANLNLKTVIDMSGSHLSPLNYIATEDGILFMVKPKTDPEMGDDIVLKFDLLSINIQK